MDKVSEERPEKKITAREKNSSQTTRSMFISKRLL